MIDDVKSRPALQLAAALVAGLLCCLALAGCSSGANDAAASGGESSASSAQASDSSASSTTSESGSSTNAQTPSSEPVGDTSSGNTETAASGLAETDRAGGFAEGEYGFGTGDSVWLPVAGGLGVSWDAPYRSGSAAYPRTEGADGDHSCTVSYGVLAAGVGSDVAAHPQAADAFGAYAAQVASAIEMHHLRAASVDSASTSEQKVGEWDMCRSEGRLACTDLFGDEADVDSVAYVGYSVLVPGTLDDPDAQTLAWFVVADDAQAPVGDDVLDDIAQKVAQSLRIE